MAEEAKQDAEPAEQRVETPVEQEAVAADPAPSQESLEPQAEVVAETVEPQAEEAAVETPATSSEEPAVEVVAEQDEAKPAEAKVETLAETAVEAVVEAPAEPAQEEKVEVVAEQAETKVAATAEPAAKAVRAIGHATAPMTQPVTQAMQPLSDLPQPMPAEQRTAVVNSGLKPGSVAPAHHAFCGAATPKAPQIAAEPVPEVAQADAE